MNTFADKIIDFNKSLDFKEALPADIKIMNPFEENANSFEVSSAFYRKYYSDTNPRYVILGINPGRLGAGLTGVPFTDSIRLREPCGIHNYTGPETYELSSVFIYEMMEQYGGVGKFYTDFYISAVCPLGFTTSGKTGKEVNCNYYDTTELTQAVYPFIIESIQKQIKMGVNTDICFCLGAGKNQNFLTKLNREYQFFREIITLEHPRYIMQYKLKDKQYYIDKYINSFRISLNN